MLLQGSQTFLPVPRRTIIGKWTTSIGSIQNKLETTSQRSLLVRSENCARYRTGILADNVERHFFQRLNAYRFQDKVVSSDREFFYTTKAFRSREPNMGNLLNKLAERETCCGHNDGGALYR